MRYPFPKYDQLFVPEFKAGAMENAGCVTFLEDYIFRSRETDSARERRAKTILHELAHMWFGDLVTMRWWDDLWLNESFATWATTWSSRGHPLAARLDHLRQLRKAWAYRQDQLPSTHPIAADIPDVEAVEVNFDGITYAKGAAVLKQLVAYVGREHFLAGLRPTSASTPGATPPWPTCWPRWSGLRPGTGRLVRGVAGDRRGEHPAPGLRATATSGSPSSRCCSRRRREAPDAQAAPYRGRPVRPDRRRPGPAATGRGRRHRRAYRVARAVRAARPT